MNRNLLKQTLNCITFDHSANESRVFLDAYLHGSKDYEFYDLLTSSDRKATIAHAHKDQNFKIFDESFKSAMAYIWILGKALEENDAKTYKVRDEDLVKTVNNTLYQQNFFNVTYEQIIAKEKNPDHLLYDMVYKLASDFTQLPKNDQVDLLDDLQHCVGTIMGTEQTIEKK